MTRLPEAKGVEIDSSARTRWRRREVTDKWRSASRLCCSLKCTVDRLKLGTLRLSLAIDWPKVLTEEETGLG